MIDVFSSSLCASGRNAFLVSFFFTQKLFSFIPEMSFPHKLLPTPPPHTNQIHFRSPPLFSTRFANEIKFKR